MSVSAEDITIGTGDHVVQFYEHDSELFTTVGAYLVDAARTGDVAIVVATEDHRRGFEAELEAAGIDVAQARLRGTYLALDAAATMDRFLVGDQPDPAAFDAVIGGLIRDAAATGRRVRAYGEMVALLWDAGHVTAALDLETLWNKLGLDAPFSLFCAYPVQAVSGSDRYAALREVCHLHSAVVQSDPNRSRAVIDLRDEWTEDGRQFAAQLDAPGWAREFVVTELRRRGCHDDCLLDDAALVVTELATNAVVHARSSFTVAVSSHGGTVRVSVHDASSMPPTRRHGGPMAQSGRGLSLVSAFACRWGTEVMTDGKVVWAELRSKA